MTRTAAIAPISRMFLRLGRRARKVFSSWRTPALTGKPLALSRTARTWPSLRGVRDWDPTDGTFTMVDHGGAAIAGRRSDLAQYPRKRSRGESRRVQPSGGSLLRHRRSANAAQRAPSFTCWATGRTMKGVSDCRWTSKDGCGWSRSGCGSRPRKGESSVTTLRATVSRTTQGWCRISKRKPAPEDSPTSGPQRKATPEGSPTRAAAAEARMKELEAELQRMAQKRNPKYRTS